MNILLTHWYTRQNKGDAAISSVMIRELRKTFPKVKLKLLSMEPEKNRKTFENTPVLSSFFALSIYQNNHYLARILSTVWTVFFSTLWATIYRYTKIELYVNQKNLLLILKAYKNSNLILAVGGGYLNGKSSLQSSLTLILQLHAIVIGLILKKPTILFSQSIGPFEKKWQKLAAAFVLKHVQLILVREKLSKNNLLKIGIPSSLIRVTVDAAFLFGNNKIDKKRSKKKQINVGVTIRRWFNSKKQEALEKEIALFIDYLAQHNCNVVFLPQVTTAEHHDDDRVVARRIYNLVENKSRVICEEKDYSYTHIYKEYAKLDILVGMRMHSNIFALTSGTPVLAIAYEHKTTEIMKDLGLSKFVLPVEKITAKQLTKLFTIIRTDRLEYTKRLKKVIPEYRLKASDSIKWVKKIYTNN